MTRVVPSLVYGPTSPQIYKYSFTFLAPRVLPILRVVSSTKVVPITSVQRAQSVSYVHGFSVLPCYDTSLALWLSLTVYLLFLLFFLLPWFFYGIVNGHSSFTHHHVWFVSMNLNIAEIAVELNGLEELKNDNFVKNIPSSALENK